MATSLSEFGYKQELSRSLSFTDLMFYGLIFMVPIAPMAIFGQVFQASGGMVALAYLIGVVALTFTAASFGQMVKAFPLAGSVYSFAGRAIHPGVGFLAGWAILLDYLLVPSLLYLVASTSMHAVVPAVPVWVWLVLFVVFNTTVSLLGIKITATATKVFLICELVVLGLFLAVGVWALLSGRGNGMSFEPLFNSGTFSVSVIFGAVSVAVLSFLGFDGIAMLSEETRGESREIGKAMAAALGLAGLLFIAQTWVAALLAPNTADLLAHGTERSNAFFDIASSAGGGWLGGVTAVATAAAWGIADSMVAQVATSRLLFAIARDGQLPRFLAKVSLKRLVPVNAILLVGFLGLVLPGGLLVFTDDQGIGVLTTLINFGAMIAFMVLHVSVIAHYLIRSGSKDYWRHLISPVIGFVILAFVVWNANLAAQIVGLIWLALGVAILGILYAAGLKPRLAGLSHERL
ncbi:APC family permease [Nonomuraea sediminis]|uniref:APC family permease n=1 Tax=Nonomuraea sediminis TaxID=2835864 RepID=UPI001BDD6FB9|nr:APC family permease [Nonomuraea sediminis]